MLIQVKSQQGVSFVSHLPSIVSARVKLLFPKTQTSTELESFFLDLSLALFDSSSHDGKLIGHIKLYGKGNSKSVIRANATGIRENAEVEIRNFHPEKEVEIWLNVIAYGLSEDEIRRGFLRTLTQATRQHEVKVRSLRVEHRHGHR